MLYTLLQGTAQALVQPMRQALVSNTVPREDLMNAIALNSSAQTMMRVVGPAIAGVLIALSGPALNFGIQSCCVRGDLPPDGADEGAVHQPRA